LNKNSRQKNTRKNGDTILNLDPIASRFLREFFSARISGKNSTKKNTGQNNSRIKNLAKKTLAKKILVKMGIMF